MACEVHSYLYGRVNGTKRVKIGPVQPYRTGHPKLKRRESWTKQESMEEAPMFPHFLKLKRKIQSHMVQVEGTHCHSIFEVDQPKASEVAWKSNVNKHY